MYISIHLQCIVFCDDVAMPSKDTYGSQPPLELLRTWLDHGYWSDLVDTTKIELVDMVKIKQKIFNLQSDHNFRFCLQQTLMSAMGTLGGSNFIFPRLYRHMFVVAVDSFEDSTIIRIFTAIGEWHFAKGYPEKVALLSRVCSISQPAHNRHVATTTTTDTTETRIHSRGISSMVFLLLFLAQFQTMAHNKIKMAYFITSFRKSSTGHVCVHPTLSVVVVVVVTL